MAGKAINTILNLKDNMSGGITRVSKKVAGMSKEAQRASKQVSNMANRFKKKVDEMASKAVKFTGIAATMAGAFAIKTGLSEAFDLEGYRMQLETATKDTQKAGEIMKYAIDLANKTPFEGGELVAGAAKFEAMGMSAQKWLGLAGDMAAATNKDFDQSVEALIDAQTGELERLKEFGLTKAMIAEKAGKMFRDVEVINNKGQITDQAKFNEAMVALMQEKYVGGMEKQASTMKGLWSTVTGVAKSSLAKIVGMSEDGTVRQGSLLDKLKEKVKQLADKFTEWQNNGTIQAISDKFSTAFTFIYDVVSRFVNFLIEHKDLFMYLGVAFAGLAVGIKVVKGLQVVMQGLQIVWALFNGTLVLTPLGWLVLGIMAVVAAGFALWRNWEKVSSGFTKIWDNIKAAFATGVNWCIDKINWLIEKVNNVFGIFGKEIPLIAEVGYRTSTDNAKTGLATQKSMDIRNGYALGTSYSRKGLTRINERSGEVAYLPSGSKVIPADKTDKLLSGNKGINVFVTIQGNVIGNEEYADYTGSVVANKVLAALSNS